MARIDAVMIARTVETLFRAQGCRVTHEYTLPNRKRLDVAGFTPPGFLFGCEIKTEQRDFERDLKWPDYARFCKLFFIAVPVGFNIDKIPLGPGVIVSDGNTAIFVRRNRWPTPQRGAGLSQAGPVWYGPGHPASIPRL